MSETHKGSGKENSNQSGNRRHYEESGYGTAPPDGIAQERKDRTNDPVEQPEETQVDGEFHDDHEPSNVDIIEENTRKRRKQKKFIIAFWTFIIAGFLGVVILFTGISLGWFGFMPSFEELENPQTFLASEIISYDNQLLGTYYVENRSKSHYSEISPNMIRALIATEDVRYMEHSGIDIKALFRVMYGAMTGQDKGGGSTITQQLAKNLFPRDYNQSTFELAFRKFKEWVIAVKLEKR